MNFQITLTPTKITPFAGNNTFTPDKFASKRQASASETSDTFVSNKKKKNSFKNLVEEFSKITCKDAEGNVLPKFRKDDLEVIKYHLRYNPQKIPPFKKMAYSSANSYVLRQILILADDKKLKKLSNYYDKNLKNTENEKYFNTILYNFSDPFQDFKRGHELKLNELLKTDLSIYMMIPLVKDEYVSPKGLCDKIKKLSNLIGNLNEYNLEKDEKNNRYILEKYSNGAKQCKFYTFNPNIKLVTDGTTYIDETNTNTVKNVIKNDRLTNTATSYISVNDNIQHLKKEFYGKDNRHTKTEVLDFSNEVPGIYNNYIVKSDGMRKNLVSSQSKVVKMYDEKTHTTKETKVSTVTANIESFDGTKTDYYYSEDIEGNRVLDYKITDKKGRELMNYVQSFEVLDNNIFRSRRNDQTHTMKFYSDKLCVTDENSKKTIEFKFDELINSSNGQNKKCLINLLKKVPGKQFMDIHKYVDKFDISYSHCVGNSYCLERKTTDGTVSKTISIGNNVFAFLHELGHLPAVKKQDEIYYNLSDNVIKNYEYERALFLKNSTDEDKKFVEYFTTGQNLGKSNSDPLKELVAETNALLNCNYALVHTVEPLRTQMLQKYFPKTIAAVAKDFENNFNSPKS